MSTARRRGTVAVGGGATVFAIAGWFGLWLIVLALVSAATVLFRRRLVTRRGLPARVAAFALHAPCGPSTPAALEHALAVDLAATCDGRLDCLERAQVVVAEGVDDPWRRALGQERLGRAHCLLTNGALPGVTVRRESNFAWLRRAAAAAALTGLLAVGTLSHSRWWLVPIAVVNAGLALECVLLVERRRTLPQRLASCSLRDPICGLFVMPEREVVHGLVVLANRDPAIIEAALRLLENAEPDIRARSRLMHAERLLVDASRAPARRSPVVRPRRSE